MTDTTPPRRVKVTRRVKMTRRTFFAALVAGAAVNLVAGGTLDPWVAAGGRYRKLVVGALRRNLAGLGFLDADFARYAADLAHTHTMDAKERQLSYIWPVYAWSDLLHRTRMAEKLENWEEKLVTHFLLSTNFFREDRNGAPRYFKLHRPEDDPCAANPFAHRRDPHEAETLAS